MNKIIILAVALVVPMAANAAAPSYSYLDISYSKQSTQIASGGKGYQLDGSYAVTNNIFIGAAYGHNSFDSGPVLGGLFTQDLIIGGGMHMPVTDAVDVVGRLAYASDYAKQGPASFLGVPFSSSDTKSGYTLGVGIRAMLMDQLELNAFLDHDDAALISHDHANSTETAASVGALYSLTSQFGLGASYSHSNRDSANTWMLSGRWYF